MILSLAEQMLWFGNCHNQVHGNHDRGICLSSRIDAMDLVLTILVLRDKNGETHSHVGHMLRTWSRYRQDSGARGPSL